MKYFFLFLLFTLNNLTANELITPIPNNFTYDKQKAFLGKKLFHDLRLSANDTISCASCHIIEIGGDDNAKFSTGINGQVGNINSPTVLNSRYSLSQFWDGRAKDLKEQAIQPIHNPVEMGSSMNQVISKLKKDKEYKKLFLKSYRDGITANNIADAIAEFEKALVTPNSRFDKYLKGDKEAITSEEKEGFELFKSNGCISCHNGVNIGGNLYQKVGIAKQYSANDNLGRYNITKKEKDKYFFKVPSLRNIELTAPYLHDGSKETLTKAVKFMTIYQLGKMPTDKEINKIVLFLKTLTAPTPKIMEQK